MPGQDKNIKTIYETTVKLLYHKDKYNLVRKVINKNKRPGGVAHTYNPSTLGGRGGWIMRSRERDHPGQQGETPSLLKIQKLAWHGGACL